MRLKSACSLLFLLVVAAPAPLAAQKFYTYVGATGTDYVLLAWGSTTGKNTIGRSSKPHGKAEVSVGSQQIAVSDRNWVKVTGLEPDKEYAYSVRLNGTRIGASKVRTWPEKSEKLRFFVIGDYGTGNTNQHRIAKVMAKEMERFAGDNPVRFLITTGDNIYGTIGLTLRFRDSGDEDDDWDQKFFRPYAPVIARIPFFASLGNHDGNETESRGDLAAYMDNLFFPSPEPARYYRFSYGGLADFFALDTTTNSEEGSPRPVFLKDGDQHKWLTKNLSESQAPWKIPYFHHPPFNAGPRHPSSRQELGHFMEVFREAGVRVVFSGHEHNFQYSAANAETGGIRYVVSGAGGELRRGDVQAEMPRASIEGWVAELHFLSVEIDGRTMRITPVSDSPLKVIGADGRMIEMPLQVKLD